jgi:hypothetical protein
MQYRTILWFTAVETSGDKLCKYKVDRFIRIDDFSKLCASFQLPYSIVRTLSRKSAVSRPVWGPKIRFLLRVCWCGAPSLTRGRVCGLQLVLALARAIILRPESRGTRDHILMSQIRDFPQPGGPGPRIYIPQEQGDPVIPPGTGFPFRYLQLAVLRWRYSNPPPHGLELLDCFMHYTEYGCLATKQRWALILCSLYGICSPVTRPDRGDERK